MKTTARYALALDPSLAETGFAVINLDTRLLATAGTIRTNPRETTAERLAVLGRRLTALLRRYRPESVAIEQPFVGRNATTALALGAVRGVVLYLCGRRQLPVHEYSTTHVKSIITGTPAATKDQVARIIRAISGRGARNHNESDAIAVALAHLSSDRTLARGLHKRRTTGAGFN
jgi:crossover junction endodeoxyribonuclease RuvC